MLIFGLNVLKEVEASKVRKAYCSRQDLIPILQSKKIKYEIKEKNFLDKMVNGNHQGIILDIYDYEYYSFKDIEGDFVVMLDHLEDPHNFGAIIRSCVGAGIKTIIIPKDRGVRVNATVTKVSAGTIEHIKIVMVTNLADTLKKLQKAGFYVYASDMDGLGYKEVQYEAKKVLVIGNEGKGVSHLIKELSDEQIKIPMNSECESLNAAVAAGILIFEMRD